MFSRFHVIELHESIRFHVFSPYFSPKNDVMIMQLSAACLSTATEVKLNHFTLRPMHAGGIVWR